MASIRFQSIGKRYGDVTVIAGLDLTIDDGEFFTFVGPSGCGKSTILNLIAGLEGVSAGRILFDGSDVTDLSPVERDVAMVFQSYALYPHLSVYDNIAFPLRMKKTPRDQIHQEVRRVVELLGLGGLLERTPHQLSGGERQRVALARAIVRRPRVFLMDEPLSNLDALLRIETRRELKRLHQELGITTVYVTHDQAEALSLSDRVAVLQGGEIRQCAVPRELYRAPANLFVASFIGSPPMNLIRGKVTSWSPLALACNGRTFTLATDGPPELSEVLLGIRPEDLDVSADGSADSLEVIVSVVEPAGSFNWVEVVWNGVRMMGRTGEGSNLNKGGKGFARFSTGHIHLFAAETGQRLE